MTDPTDEEARYAHLAEGNAKQARKRVAVDLLIRNTRNEVLLVNPTYKEYWDLPGGMAESNERPRASGERELREELGIAVTAGELLLLDWIAPHGPWDDQFALIFDGGVIDPAREIAIQVSDPEISEFAFFNLTAAKAVLRQDMAQRLERAYHALTSKAVDYREH